MIRWLGWALLAFGSGCLAEYTVGGANTGGCGDGEVQCGDECVAAGACDDECPEGQVKCGDACAPADTCTCDGGCDATYEVCREGVCECRPGLTRCEAACVNIRADPDHCGGCAGVCGGGTTLCQASDCVGSCAAPLMACGGGCVDPGVDSLHCGECEKVCPSDEVCMAGECRRFHEISDCMACPCPNTCDQFNTAEGGENGEGECCDSPFVGGPVCVEDGCD